MAAHPSRRWIARSLWLLVFSAAVLTLSGIPAFEELRFALVAPNAPCVVTKVDSSFDTSRRGGAKEFLDISYRFTDASGRERNETDQLASTATAKSRYIVGATESVRYLSNKSRLAEHPARWSSVAVFAIAVLVTVSFVAGQWRAYRAEASWNLDQL